MLQNEWQPNILDRLYQIMFKIIILSQIGADRYQKTYFRNTTFVDNCLVPKRDSTNERTPLSVPMSPSHSEYLKFVNKGPSAQDNVKW